VSDQLQTHVDGSAPAPGSPAGGRPESAISARVHTVGCSGLRTLTIRGFRLSSGDGADVAGFDLGPSPEEHLLAAVGSSLAQTIAHVACAHGLSLDRIDLDLSADLARDQTTVQIAGQIVRIAARAELTSEDDPGQFATLADDVLDVSPFAALITAPIALTIAVAPVEASTSADDWEI